MGCKCSGWFAFETVCGCPASFPAVCFYILWGIPTGDAQLMISMLSRYQLSEVDLLCATCTLIFFLKQGCISHHCGQLNNIEINFKRLHLVTFMSYIQPIAWSAELAPLGFRLLRRAAFPFIRANDNLNTIDSAVCYQSMYHHILPLF